MRLPLLAALLTLACAADPVLLPDSGPCSSACGPGTVCSGGACVAVDAGGVDSGGPMDVGAPVDLGTPDTGTPDAGFDVGTADAGADAGAGADVPRDVDPRQSEVCRGITATCDGRTVNVQGGEVDGGRTYHCGGCGITCEPGSFCVNCVCAR